MHPCFWQTIEWNIVWILIGYYLHVRWQMHVGTFSDKPKRGESWTASLNSEKTNLAWKWQMLWLQEYYFLHVGTLCDASKQIFFLSIVCSDCKMDGCDGSKRILFWRDQCKNCIGIFCDSLKRIFFSMLLAICFST